MNSILDPKFKYTPASKTDIRKTFRRELKRLEGEAEARRQQEHLTNIACMAQRRGVAK